MTLAEFYATHRSPQAIVLPRPAARPANARRGVAETGRSDAKSASGTATAAIAAGAVKKH